MVMVLPVVSTIFEEGRVCMKRTPPFGAEAGKFLSQTYVLLYNKGFYIPRVSDNCLLTKICMVRVQEYYSVFLCIGACGSN